jgi:arylsulfatase A-like enzyme
MRLFLFAIIVVLSFTKCQNSKIDPHPTHPNIIYIMTDDHAKNALSCFGSQLIETPHLDRLAKEGIVFDQAYVTNALCGPSRAVCLTGKFSHINGFRHNQDEFDGSQETFIKLLKEAGYFTGVVGKWHLKSTPQGFDYWKILIGQGEYYNPRWITQGDTSQEIGYTTSLITDSAIETLEKRDKNDPFCLMVHHKAPHRNWMPDLKDLDPDNIKKYPLPSNFYDEYTGRPGAIDQDLEIKDMFYSLDMKLNLPGDMEDPGTGGFTKYPVKRDYENTLDRLTPEQKKAWDDFYKPISDQFFASDLKGKELEEWMYQRYMHDYLLSVKSVDDNVGRLYKYLEDNGLLENTMIVYTSDQGFFLGEHGWYDKRYMYEESMGMPLIVRMPNAENAGSRSNALVQNLDFAPTFLDYAGVVTPQDMQGQSLMPLINNEKKNVRSALYYHYYEYPFGWHYVKKHYGIKGTRYKLIHFYDDIDEWELYDLEKDPAEMNNLNASSEHQGIVDSMKMELNKLIALYEDPIGKEWQ